MKQSLLRFSGITTLLFSVFTLVITGCQRDLSDPGGSNNPGTPPPAGGGSTVNDNVMVVAGVRGTVIDANNIPVEGATVSSGANTTTTDRYGAFKFTNINLSKNNGQVKVVKQGYFNSIRSFIPTAGRIHNVRIKLLPKSNTGSFTASAGGTVNLASGGKLVMPANAVADASGNAYSGSVNVAMTWINPVSTDLPYVVPGDLRGITTAGEERGLETYGMIGVELTGSSGQALNVAAGKTAELTFPIPSSLQGNAPATIDLWHFDEATARWKQEGTATKSGANYIAQVSHFSFWNCDAQFPIVDLCMKIVSNVENIPLNNVQVRIKRPNGSFGYGRTDSLGNLCGKVPSNEALVLEILGQCGNVVLSQNIGPFSGASDLGTIVVTLPVASTLTITGTLVNCSNANVTNGAVVIYTGNAYSYQVPVTNGTFSLNVLRCDNTPLNFSVLGVDYATLQQGTPASGTGTTGTVNVGTVQACGTSSAQYIEYLIDGAPFTFAAPPDFLSTTDSTSAGVNAISIFGSKSGSGTNTQFTNIRFPGTGSTGPRVLTQCRLGAGPLGYAEVIVSSSPTINITTFGPPVTGFIEGNFNVQMNFAGTPKTVICTFKVRRGG
jgi:hypothetical protein